MAAVDLYRQIDKLSEQIGALKAENRDLRASLDAAEKWIRTVTEELVKAGGQAGGRRVALVNLRSLIASQIDPDALDRLQRKAGLVK